MKSYLLQSRRLALAFAAGCLAFTSAAPAADEPQPAAAAPAPARPPPPAATATADAAEEQTVVLSEFVITTEGREGYYATNSIGATRLATPIQDLPLSIQIVTDELIRDMGAQRVEDSLRFVSGVNLQNRNDLEDAGETYNIRGFRSRMLLRNGIPFNAFTDTVNILQLEVVKGPSSVLYGVSDPGGLVNVVTKRPLTEPHYQVALQAGEWGLRRGTFDFTGPLTADKRVAYRLTGMYETFEDFRPFVDDKKMMLDGALAFQINKTNRLNLEYVYGNQDNAASSRRPYPTVRQGQSRYFAPFDWSPYGMGFTMSTPHDFQDLTQQFAEGVWESQLAENVKLRVAYAWTERDNDKFSNAQSTFNAAGTVPKLAQREQYVFDQDNIYVDLLAKYDIGSTVNTTLVGLQYREEQFTFYNALWGTQYGGPLGPPARYLDPTQPEEELYWMPPLDEMVNLDGYDPQRSTTRTQGVFATHQIGFMENRLRITGGLRYEDLKSRDLSATTPQLGLVYKVTPAVSLFGSYNESFYPNTQIDPATGEVFDPEEGVGMDVGVKFELFNRRFVGTASFFEVKKTNVVNYNSRREPGDPEWLLSGRLRSRGFEFDGIVSPLRNLQVILAYGYHDAEELENLQYPDFVPYQLDGSSKHNVGVWGKYRLDQGPLKGVSFGAGYQYRQGPINLFPNGANRVLTQDTYQVWDFYVRYTRQFGDVSATLSVNLNNAFDEIYMNKTSWWADPQNWMFGLSFDF